MELAITVGATRSAEDKLGLEGMIEAARVAEDLGFSVVFMPDHYVYEMIGTLQTEEPTYDLFFVLATIAQHTKRIRIGSHVACMLFRHPAMHARLFAQVDEASNGRVIAGVGAGWTRAEFEMMHIPFPPISERLQMMDEAVTIMRGLWSEERFTFHGKHYQVTDAVCLPKPIQKPGPPLMLGGSGNGILRRAGEWADILHMVPQTGAAGTTTMDAVREFTDAAIGKKLARMREAEKKAGRAPGSVRFATTVFSYSLCGSAAETKMLADGASAMFGVPADEILRHPGVLMGTPEEMTEELRRREQLHGLSNVAISFTGVQQMREFGEKVLPKLG
jgi:probable F420-dependent oxidoreductase